MLASDHIIKQVIPATPGWYMIFKDNSSTKHIGKLIPAWGVIEKFSVSDQAYFTSIEPLHPEGDSGNLDTWTDCADFVTTVFRPEWFRASNAERVEISNFKYDKLYRVTDG